MRSRSECEQAIADASKKARKQEGRSQAVELELELEAVSVAVRRSCVAESAEWERPGGECGLESKGRESGYGWLKGRKFSSAMS
jgi:hypothetical protein